MPRRSFKREWEAYKRFIDEYVLGGWEPEGVMALVARVIAGTDVIHREELVRIVEEFCKERCMDSDYRVTIRTTLHYLRNAGLIYVRKHCRKCYIVSTPALFFVDAATNGRWLEWLRRKGPDISRKEVEELKEWVKLSKLSSEELKKLSEEERELARKLRRVRRLAEWRLETLKYMADLFEVVNSALSDRCFKPAIEYARGVHGSIELAKWYLDCYVPLLYDYIPLLLRMLAGIAYSYATGYNIKHYIAELRRVTRYWLEERCRDNQCPETTRKLAEETVSRIANLVQHILQLLPSSSESSRKQSKAESTLTSLNEFIEEYKKELQEQIRVRKRIRNSIKSDKVYQEIGNKVYIVRKFLLETLREFYLWTPLIVQELKPARETTADKNTTSTQ